MEQNGSSAATMADVEGIRVLIRNVESHLLAASFDSARRQQARPHATESREYHLLIRIAALEDRVLQLERQLLGRRPKSRRRRARGRPDE